MDETQRTGQGEGHRQADGHKEGLRLSRPSDERGKGGAHCLGRWPGRLLRRSGHYLRCQMLAAQQQLVQVRGVTPRSCQILRSCGPGRSAAGFRERGLPPVVHVGSESMSPFPIRLGLPRPRSHQAGRTQSAVGPYDGSRIGIRRASSRCSPKPPECRSTVRAPNDSPTAPRVVPSHLLADDASLLVWREVPPPRCGHGRSSAGVTSLYITTPECPVPAGPGERRVDVAARMHVPSVLTLNARPAPSRAPRQGRSCAGVCTLPAWDADGAGTRLCRRWATPVAIRRRILIQSGFLLGARLPAVCLRLRGCSRGDLPPCAPLATTTSIPFVFG